MGKKLMEALQLHDDQGRHIHKVRVQLTDACNFRCFYCMPENMNFQPANTLLSSSEFFSICSILNQLGIDELRVTGGEPTLRTDFPEIIQKLSRIPWKKFGLTTNGFLLQKHLPLLKELGCQNLNISMDSLQANKFNRFTRRQHFNEVIESIFAAKNMGFEVKVNAVIFRGINDDEILDFVKFSAENDLEVRFLELMKIGPAYENHPERFISAQEMIDSIENLHELIAIPMPRDSTSFNFTNLNGARIGFIASESQPFCGGCSRLRLTATGKLRACLFSEEGLNLRNLDPLDYLETLHRVMALKPSGRIHHIDQPMNQIGG